MAALPDKVISANTITVLAPFVENPSTSTKGANTVMVLAEMTLSESAAMTL